MKLNGQLLSYSAYCVTAWDTGSLCSSSADALSNVEEAVILHVDNTASICVGNSSEAIRRSRHINVSFHNVKDAVRDNMVKLEYIPTKNNLADFFT